MSEHSAGLDLLDLHAGKVGITFQQSVEFPKVARSKQEAGLQAITESGRTCHTAEGRGDFYFGAGADAKFRRILDRYLDIWFGSYRQIIFRPGSCGAAVEQDGPDEQPVFRFPGRRARTSGRSKGICSPHCISCFFLPGVKRHKTFNFTGDFLR